jgi:hypothetical protein
MSERFVKFGKTQKCIRVFGGETRKKRSLGTSGGRLEDTNK